MELGTPKSPSGLELTIATPSSGNDGNKGSSVENTMELDLLGTFNHPVSGGGEDLDTHIISMETGDGEDRPPINRSSFERRKYNRFSREQSDMLEESFQQNHYPDKEIKQDLADTLKVTLKQVEIWFLNRRSRMKKQKIVQNCKEHKSCKKQVELLTNETHHLRHKIYKLKKKLNKLKLKETPSIASPPPSPPPPPEQEQQHVMYVPVLAGLFPNGEKNAATTAATISSIITQQGSASATTNVPAVITNQLLLPPSGGSNI